MKKIARDIIRVIKKTAYNILKKHFVYIAEDPADVRKKFALIENLGPLPRYNRLYLGITQKIKIRRKITFNRPAVIKRLANNYGLVITPFNNSVTTAEALTVPDFIDLSIKLPADIDTYQKTLPNTARYDVRKIRDGGFTPVISADASWVSTFYHDYYKPSMLKHGEEAYIISENKMQALMQTGNFEFVKIYDGDICVSAVFAKIEPDKYYYYKIGWLNGNDKLVKQGAAAAMYWFVIQRAYALNRTEVVLGGTPAYLENGVFKYKAKWMAGFTARTYGLNQLFLNPDNQQCYNFLLQVSLIALNKNNAHIVLSAKTRNNAGVTGAILNSVSAWYVLLESRADHYDDDVKELPPALRHWYKKVL